jgi:hypothetical protein
MPPPARRPTTPVPQDPDEITSFTSEPQGFQTDEPQPFQPSDDPFQPDEPQPFQPSTGSFQPAPLAADDDPFALEEPFPPTEPQRPEFYREPAYLPEEPQTGPPPAWGDPDMQDEFVVAASPSGGGGGGGGGRFSRAGRGTREPKAPKAPRAGRAPRGPGGPRNLDPRRLILIAVLGVVIVVAVVILFTTFLGGDDPADEFLTVPTPASRVSIAPSTPRRTPRPRPSVPTTPIPGLVDRNCSDFDTQQDAQNFFAESGGPSQDLHGLDPDGNGSACDELAGAPPAAPGGATTPAPPAATQAPVS